MAAAYFEELRGRLFGLLIVLEDRLGAGQAHQIHHFIEVGEYGLALEEIVGILAQARTPIADRERGDILALARKMQMDDLLPRTLEGCPRAR